MSCPECNGTCQVCEICWQPECRHHEFKGPELFDLPESKSPKLQWMEKHGIRTSPPVGGLKGILCQWMACGSANQIPSMSETGYGHTEDEAITQLALKLGIKMWFEEGQP